MTRLKATFLANTIPLLLVIPYFFSLGKYGSKNSEYAGVAAICMIIACIGLCVTTFIRVLLFEKKWYEYIMIACPIGAAFLGWIVILYFVGSNLILSLVVMLTALNLSIPLPIWLRVSGRFKFKREY